LKRKLSAVALAKADFLVEISKKNFGASNIYLSPRILPSSRIQ